MAKEVFANRVGYICRAGRWSRSCMAACERRRARAISDAGWRALWSGNKQCAMPAAPALASRCCRQRQPLAAAPRRCPHLPCNGATFAARGAAGTLLGGSPCQRTRLNCFTAWSRTQQCRKFGERRMTLSAPVSLTGETARNLDGCSTAPTMLPPAHRTLRTEQRQPI